MLSVDMRVKMQHAVVWLRQYAPQEMFQDIQAKHDLTTASRVLSRV